MREELIRLLQEKVGLDRAKAEQAADVSLNYVKEHGPEMIRQLMGSKAGGLGGLLDR